MKNNTDPSNGPAAQMGAIKCPRNPHLLVGRYFWTPVKRGAGVTRESSPAATGKGFAIGSAALTALALLAAYVEEVRRGFDRGAEATITAEYEPGIYKLSNQFIVQVKGDEEHYPFLLLPSDLRTIDGWNDEEYQTFREKPVKVADSLFTEKMIEGGPTLAIAENGRELVPLAAATLPDFTRYYDATLMNPKVLVGVFLGAMATFVFCAMTMKAVGRAAKGMVEEVRRQFREKPGIMEGTELPDYVTPVAISTRAAQREMIVPSLLALLTPVTVGIVLGVAGVMGLLVGALTSGFCLAVFMANAGGAWDNAKKSIEAGKHGGKGTDAHKAAVVGDTVGDPFKDTSGPSLNILIKLMSMVAVVVAGLTVRYSLIAMGIF